jgi:acetyl esterase/lipase
MSMVGCLSTMFALPLGLQKAEPLPRSGLFRQIRLATLGVLIATAGPAGANAEPQGRVEVPKIEREGVWQPSSGGVQIPLWTANVPLAKPDSGDRPEATGHGSSLVAGREWQWASYVTRPTMTVFAPKGRNTGAAMLVLPGGGFRAIATDLEGTEVCDWVTAQGMTCVMLKYRTPQVWPRIDGKQTRPAVLLGLEDAQRAMTLLRHDAAIYGIEPDKIGAIGFSAGAYIVTELSNQEARTYPLVDDADRQSTRPDFAVVVYTARLLDNSKGKNSLELKLWVRISNQAPPTLIIHALNDDVDDVRQPLAYMLALKDAGVSVDLRVYAKGGHAFGMRQTDDPITHQWPLHLREWLQNIGVI